MPSDQDSPTIEAPGKSTVHVQRDVGILLSEARVLLGALPSPQAKALAHEIAGASAPVSSALRGLVEAEFLQNENDQLRQELQVLRDQQHQRQVVQTRRAIRELVPEVVALLEALPSPHAKALAADLGRARTPLSGALLEHAGIHSDAARHVATCTPVYPTEPGTGQNRSLPVEGTQSVMTSSIAQSQVSTHLAQQVAQHKWPYTPCSSADLEGKEILHNSSVELVKESQKLLASLPDEEASRALMMMLEGDSVLAAAMRSRMPVADHARLFQQSERPSSVLNVLVEEGQHLLDLLPEPLAADVLQAIAHSDQDMARLLCDKLASPAETALRQLVDESKVMIAGLSDEHAQDLLQATMHGDCAMSSLLRERIFEMASSAGGGSDDRDMSLLQSTGGMQEGEWEGGDAPREWSGLSRRWWRRPIDASFDSVLSANASLFGTFKVPRP